MTRALGALVLLSASCGQPFQLLAGGYQKDDVALHYLGHTIFKSSELGTPSPFVLWSVEPGSYTVDITGDRQQLEKVKAELGTKIVAAAARDCNAQIGGSIGTNNTRIESISFTKEIQPNNTSWIYTSPSVCCEPDGSVKPLCADSGDSVIVAFYQTRAKFVSTANHGLDVGAEVTCQGAGADIGLTIGAQRQLIGSSEGWNVVKVLPLKDVCHDQRQVECKPGFEAACAADQRIDTQHCRCGEPLSCPANHEAVGHACVHCAYGTYAMAGSNRCLPILPIQIGGGAFIPRTHVRCKSGGTEKISSDPEWAKLVTLPEDGSEATGGPNYDCGGTKAKALYWASSEKNGTNAPSFASRSFSIRGDIYRSCAYGPDGSDASFSPKLQIETTIPPLPGDGGKLKASLQYKFVNGGNNDPSFTPANCHLSAFGEWRSFPNSEGVLEFKDIVPKQTSIVFDCQPALVNGCYGHPGGGQPPWNVEQTVQLQLMIRIDRVP